jgi:hypothetical protein
MNCVPQLASVSEFLNLTTVSTFERASGLGADIEELIVQKKPQVGQAFQPVHLWFDQQAAPLSLALDQDNDRLESLSHYTQKARELVKLPGFLDSLWKARS